jgi:hypothetical protein
VEVVLREFLAHRFDWLLQKFERWRQRELALALLCLRIIELVRPLRSRGGLRLLIALLVVIVFVVATLTRAVDGLFVKGYAILVHMSRRQSSGRIVCGECAV